MADDGISDRRARHAGVVGIDLRRSICPIAARRSRLSENSDREPSDCAADANDAGHATLAQDRAYEAAPSPHGFTSIRDAAFGSPTTDRLMDTTRSAPTPQERDARKGLPRAREASVEWSAGRHLRAAASRCPSWSTGRSASASFQPAKNASYARRAPTGSPATARARPSSSCASGMKSEIGSTP